MPMRALAPNPYILSVGIGILNYAVLSTAWNFVGGFTGYISLGHGALSGLGAYGTALLVTKASAPSFVALLAAAAIVALLAVPIGFAALRVRGASFVIVSIALVLILLLVFQSWASFTGGSLLTSGPAGPSVDSIAASLTPAASRNASTCVLS
jgi:branched-chain amino acid transport system permease protein